MSNIKTPWHPGLTIFKVSLCRVAMSACSPPNSETEEIDDKQFGDFPWWAGFESSWVVSSNRNTFEEAEQMLSIWGMCLNRKKIFVVFS